MNDLSGVKSILEVKMMPVLILHQSAYVSHEVQSPHADAN